MLINHQQVYQMNIPNTSLFQPKQDIQIKQVEDPSIQPFILHFRDGNPLMKRKLQSPDQRILFHHLGSLVYLVEYCSARELWMVMINFS